MKLRNIYVYIFFTKKVYFRIVFFCKLFYCQKCIPTTKFVATSKGFCNTVCVLNFLFSFFISGFARF